MKRLRLGVNIDHVATLREVRKAAYPDPVQAAFLAEEAGADQITVHLREDRRHIQDRDLALLRKTVRTRLNLEMAATQEMLTIALDLKPDIVTFVPERREELTTEGGLDVVQRRDAIASMARLLQDADIRVMLFVDPDLDQVRAAHKVNADGVEFHTGKYAEASVATDGKREFARLEEAVRMAAKLGLVVAAGHGLHYHNVAALTHLEDLEELNIGHSIVARAVMTGLPQAVRDLIALLERP